METKIRIDVRALAAAYLFLLSYGCSTEEFGSFTGQFGGGNSAYLTDDKGGVNDDEGLDGEDGSGGDDVDGDLADDDDDGKGKGKKKNKGDKGDGIDVEEDELENACRFFADEDYAEVVEGGPGIAISPQKMDGHWEGDEYVFEFAAWQGPMGAQAQLHPGGPVVTIGVDFDTLPIPDMVRHLLPQTNEMGVVKGKDHWQLERIMTSPYTYYGVKHTYQGVISNAKKKSCEIHLTETTTPFLDRTGGGCFARTTKIRMADGSERFVALLNVGDMVLNPVTGKPARITEITSGPEADQQMLKIGYGGYSVRVTQKHPMVTETGLKQARHLTKADKVFGADGRFHKVELIEALPLDAKQVVRNLVINPDSKDPRDHMVLADGIVTGDLYLQRQLESEEKATIVAKAMRK